MAEEEIGKINRKLQKMIDKSEVVNFRTNKTFFFFCHFLFRMKQLHEIYLSVYKIRVLHLVFFKKLALEKLLIIYDESLLMKIYPLLLKVF